jgi:hypothetical protein
MLQGTRLRDKMSRSEARELAEQQAMAEEPAYSKISPRLPLPELK